MVKFSPLFLIAALFLLTGCLNQDPPPRYYDITGQITENGEPVNNVHLHFRNNLEPGGFLEEVVGDSLDIAFPSVYEGVYTASLYRYRGDTALTVFFEDSLGLGDQVISIPDSILSNGIHAYEITTDIERLGSSLFLVNKIDTALAGTIPFATTDSEGNFTLTVANLAIGETFNFTAGGGFEVTDSLEIIAIKDGQVRANEYVRIVPDQENFFEITLD